MVSTLVIAEVTQEKDTGQLEPEGSVKGMAFSKIIQRIEDFNFVGDFLV